MAWENAEVPDREYWRQEAEITVLRAELEFWKKRADSLANELSNIPKALRDHGRWYITGRNGEVTHVILDPAHHPPKGESSV